MKKNEKCIIIQDMMPLYLEELVADETREVIERHLSECKMCREVRKKMEINIQIDQKPVECDTSVINYIRGMMVWYMLCPMCAVLFMVLGWSEVLKIYSGIIMMIAASCVASEVFYKSTWWDPECMKMQEEIRATERNKRGNFYIRPFWIGLPALLVTIMFQIPKILQYISMLI